MPDYPALNSPVPQLYTQDDVSTWYQQLQNLAVVDAVIKKCERCAIPVDPSRRECDALCTFFQGLIAEETAQNTTSPRPLS